jgi:hypothetical protein
MIRKLLKLYDLADVDVGSVEQFQGQVRGKQRLPERNSSADSCALSYRNEKSSFLPQLEATENSTSGRRWASCRIVVA